MCFVYVDRPLTPPSPLVDKHGHFDNSPSPLLGLRGLYTDPKNTLSHVEIVGSEPKYMILNIIGHSNISQIFKLILFKLLLRKFAQTTIFDSQ